MKSDMADFRTAMQSQDNGLVGEIVVLNDGAENAYKLLASGDEAEILFYNSTASQYIVAISCGKNKGQMACVRDCSYFKLKRLMPE